MSREMKDSGLPWIGEIPASWRCLRGKYALEYLQKPVEDTDGVITCFRDGEVTLRSNRREDGFTISEKEIGYQGIDVGDLVVHGMDGFAGSIGISDSRGKASPVLVVLNSKENKRFLMYYLRNMAYSDVFLALATGIRVRSCDLRWNKLAETIFALPPIQEQNAIVSYIDKKTAEIDAAINETKSLIDKYKAYKQSIITEAVTKGLNPNVKVKDSRIEWIGEIPEHWGIERIKYLFSFGKGLNITKADLTEQGSPVISYGQIHSKINTGVSIKKELVRFVPKEITSIHPGNQVHIGDFIFADTSEDIEGCGNCVYIDKEGVYAGYHSLVLDGKGRDNKYLAYLFKSDIWRIQVRSKVSGIKVFSITQSIINKCTVILPPLSEQQQIANYLDTKCSQIDAIISQKEQLITRLQVYKKSIIFEYVTGKKEVPNA